MLKIYWSELCPDCIACKANLDANGIEYELLEINKSIPVLKEFLKHRDTDPAFAHCKENGSIGIPALLHEDGSISLDWENYLSEIGH